MTGEEFWKIIEISRVEFDPQLRDGNQARQVELLEVALRALRPQELVDYERFFTESFFMLYTWQHWAAVYLIEGGCSDDGFDYFSAWMISMGEQAFSAVVASPDNLADYAYLPGVEVIAFPDIMGSGSKIYEEMTGLEIPDSCYQPGRPDEPLGTRWDETDLSQFELALPKVWRACCDSWPTDQLT